MVSAVSLQHRNDLAAPATGPAAHPVPFVGAADFDKKVLGSKVPVAVEFMIHSCSDCKRADPLVAEVASELAGKVAFYKVNVGLDPELKKRFNIRRTPTLVMFHGGKEVGREASPYPKAAVIKNAVLAPIADALLPKVATDADRFEKKADPKPAPAPKDGRAILLFNGECKTCRSIAGWIWKNDEPANGGRQRIDERPIGHDPDAIRAISPELDIWKAYDEVHVVTPDGKLHAGGEAIREVFKRLPETSWFSWLFDVGVGTVKPFQWALDGAYVVLDKMRPALGCESCGHKAPWWGKPIVWALDGWKWMKGGSKEEPRAIEGGKAAPKT